MSAVSMKQYNKLVEDHHRQIRELESERDKEIARLTSMLRSAEVTARNSEFTANHHKQELQDHLSRLHMVRQLCNQLSSELGKLGL